MRAGGIHEYTRECRREGALLFRTVLLFVVYLFMAFVTVLFSLVLLSIPAFILLFSVSCAVFLVTRPLLSEQRDYEIVDGNLRIYRVYGKAHSRLVFECELKDMTELFPYKASDPIDGVDRVDHYLSDSKSTDAYCAVYVKNGMRCAAIIDGDEKLTCAASFYCRRAFRQY